MRPWKRKRGMLRGGARYVTVLEPAERALLGELSATVADALIARAQSAPKDELSELTGMPSGHAEAPEDPRLARLLPDFAAEGDESVEGENQLMRQLHESDIVKEKLTDLRSIIEALEPADNGHVSLTEEKANQWIAAINSLRLYLHATLEGHDGPIVKAEETDAMYQWLSYNQESLVQELMRE